MIQQVADHEAEDRTTRERIGSSLGETLFVEAGAGTGKTSALVDRVVALVIGGKAIERIVAITFTERAAAELRDRVRAGLEAAREQRAENATAVEQALASLDRAQISTIHSFCQGILYSFAAEAGIDPSFRVQDEVMAERRFQERWRLYLESLGEDQEAGRAIDRALGLGLSTWHMETLAVELTKRPDLSALLDANPPTSDTFAWPDIQPMGQALTGLPLAVAPLDDKLRQRVERLSSLVSELLRSDADRESALAAGAEILATKWNVSNQDTWGKDTLKRVRDVASEVAETLNEALRACRSQALAGVLPLVVRFVLADAYQRGRDGTLTFDDLILLVRDLLGSNREAVQTLRARYEVMLIDEFQDTDPLQVEIALAFATNPDSGAVEPGRLFLVGDPKQSIYRFRRADMAIYSQTRDKIEGSGGSFPNLALNRRSRGAVLDWVNKVFEPLIGPGWEQDVQPEYRPVFAGRPGIDLAGPGVAWIGGETGGAKASAVREIEAGAIAANCLAVLQECWEVAERDGTRRSAKLSDIAVLIPTRAVLAALERRKCATCSTASRQSTTPPTRSRSSPRCVALPSRVPISSWRNTGRRVADGTISRSDWKRAMARLPMASGGLPRITRNGMRVRSRPSSSVSLRIGVRSRSGCWTRATGTASVARASSSSRRACSRRCSPRACGRSSTGWRAARAKRSSIAKAPA